MADNFSEWSGGQITSTYNDSYVQARNKLADLAYAGRFDQALELIEKNDSPNSWRLRSEEEFASRPPTGWTILHQAAMLPSSDLSHIERLISLGAYRNLRTLDTHETAYDIAKRQGRSRDILSALKPVYRRKLDEQTIANLQRGLDEVIYSRVERLMNEHKFRTPPVEVLLELQGMHFWCPIPGFYGGFHIKLTDENKLETESFCRVAGGSGETHLIDPDGKWKCVASGLY
ncbi:hypothetical protein Dda_3980 [Drechslerella dactyloides]|uniref:Ankyrin repeat protein n=1 Tax=Drechslerella dactyloides TaxID=74499 RepID=A0AAD6NJ05_DREDA|nr:hypothetical protein Dda_3980 [Drechslerella dactyloides]